MFKNIDINFNKALKYVLIGFAVFFVIGTIFAIIWGGVNLSIDFKGGTRISYTYDGGVDFAAAEPLIEDEIGKDVVLSENVGLADDSKSLIVTLVGEEAISTDDQMAIEDVIVKAYPESNCEFSESKSVSPSLAGAFFLKCIVGVLIAGALVTVYVGIRFRKIGGVQAAITAFAALFLDVFVAFFTCTIFNLQIDMNFVAVLLTIFGYSLNDTIVIFDRIREFLSLYPKRNFRENINNALCSTLARTINTSGTTLVTLLAIFVFGGATIRGFVFALLVGVIVGTYSSLFIATPLAYDMLPAADKK